MLDWKDICPYDKTPYKRWWKTAGLAVIALSLIQGVCVSQDSAGMTEILGRPTDTSITISFCMDRNAHVFVEYGTAPMTYTMQSTIDSIRGGVPAVIVLQHLLQSTRYYYRIQYRTDGSTAFTPRDEHSFHTARSKGETFSFAVEADPHMDGNTNPDLYRLTLSNIAKKNPDFLFDLGDTFMSEKLQNKSTDSILARHLLLRSYFDYICHSIPLFLVIGNHEGELGWLLDSTANNLAVKTSTTRTTYFPNPVPSAFYTGNSQSEPYVGLRQNYYAWEWGDALFVVLDPYWYTRTKPRQYADNWNWTLGETQYRWFRSTLESSTAKFKFVFAHQVLGGTSAEGRGGAEAVPFFEMGGNNADSSWGFTSHRPGWDMPLHQLMVSNHVNAFFHGHDHFYAKQDVDGIVYQEVPQPGNPNYNNANNASEYGYVTGTILPCAGFLLVTVSDSVATVEYVRSYLPESENKDRINGSVSHSYTMAANIVSSIDAKQNARAGRTLAYSYPNPAHSFTTIRYDVSERNRVTLKVYNVLGNEVASLVDDIKDAGEYAAHWSPADLPFGLYVYRLVIGRDIATGRILLW
jgi:hypothetical protein